MGNKHTPGPWETTGTKKLYIEPINMKVRWDWFSDDCKRCNMTKSSDINEGSQIYNPRKLKEAQANARLIAAAPELLEACKYVVKWHRENDSGEGELYGLDFVTTCIGAIAKATGE